MSKNVSFSCSPISIIDCLDNDFRQQLAFDIGQGLSSEPKTLSSKYFYDHRGSMLFEEICRLPEYYLTRCELEVLQKLAPKLRQDLTEVDIIELGSGSNWKIKSLLEATNRNNLQDIRYIPVDVCGDYLKKAAQELIEYFPDISILGIIADFTRHVDILPQERKRLIFFLGSTLGNFSDKEVLEFLFSMYRNMRKGDHLFLGLDMLKPIPILENAYNDALGITAAFNKNILQVINKELNANFDIDLFEHLAFFNTQKKRIEMHLKALQDMQVYVADLNMQVPFKRDETIHTEISRKFSPKEIESITAMAGFFINHWIYDKQGMFSLLDLIV